MDFRKWRILLWAIAAALNAAGLYMVFFFVPAEMTMGEVQKIFYYHVPSAISAYVLFALAFVFSLFFLWKEEPLWDSLAHACAEVGWVFITVVLVTGPIWGRAAWGKWWVWEPRLTTALVLWLMYTAYFLLRLFSGHDARTARVAAVMAIVAFFDVPIVHFAIKWWGSIVHPPKVSLEPAMRLTFLVTSAAVLSLAAALTLTRASLGFDEARSLAEEAQ